MEWRKKKKPEKNWNKVLFSDESKIVIGHDQQVFIWPNRNEGWRPNVVPPRTLQSRYEVIIGSCICSNTVDTGKWTH